MPSNPILRMEDVPPQVWFGRYNFQCERDLAVLTGYLGSEGGPSTLLLAGQPGIGRSYLLEAACFRLREGGLPVEVLEIDLEGFEEGRSLADYLRVQIRKRRAEEEAAREKLIAGLLGATEVGLQGIGWATLFSVSLSLHEPLAALRSFFAAKGPGHTGPLVSPREAFAGFIDSWAGRVVLHVKDPTQFHQVPSEQNPRRWLPEVVERFDRATLVISCGPADTATALVPSARREVARIDLRPLDVPDIAELLDSRLAPNEFPEDFASALCRYSRGLPGMVGLAVGRLYRLEALNESGDGTWTVDDDRAAQVLSEGLIEPVSRAIEAQGEFAPALHGFLLDAALCGELVPASLLLRLQGLVGDEVEDCGDLVESKFITALGIFDDLEYGHATFPKNVWMLRFREPLLRLAILEHFSPTERRARAQALEAALKVAVKVESRDVARLFVSLSEHVGEAERNAYLRELEWWVGLDEAEALQREMRQTLEVGRLKPETVWQMVQATRGRWHPSRSLAVLNAYAGEGQVGGQVGDSPLWLPIDRIGIVHETRAFLLRDLGREVEALSEAVRARDVAEAEEGPRSMRYLNRLAFCADLQLEVGEIATAQVSLLEALGMASRMLGSQHAASADIKHSLARTFRAQGDFPEARRLFKEALEAKCRQLGPDHLETLNTKQALAGVMQDQGEFPEALQLLKEILEAECRYLGSEHPKALATRAQLAAVLRQQKDLPEARRLQEEVLAAQSRQLGPEHPHTLMTKHEVALIHYGMGNFPEARRFLEEVVDANLRHFGPVHPYTLTTKHNLACLARDQGFLREARRLFEEILESGIRQLGAQHPVIVTTRRCLERLT